MRKRDDCKKEESFDTNRNKEELGQELSCFCESK